MFKQLALAFFGATAVLAQADAIIADLNSIKSQTDSLTTALKNFDGTVAGGVPILTATNKLKTTTQGAISDANAAGTVSEADQAMVLQAAEDLYPSIIASLQAFVSQSSAFQKAGLSSTASQQLNQLASLSANLGNALVSKATGDFKTAAQDLLGLINDAFDSAKAGNSPQAGNVPDIPSAGGNGGGSGGSSSTMEAESSTMAAKPTTYAGSSAPAATSYAASTPATPAPSTPAPPATSYAATSAAPAPAPTYTGAAAKVANNVGGAVLLAAAAFAL